MKIVIIGDLHAHPDYDIERFRAAGQLCAEQWPDVIVQIGDWADMCSINQHGSRFELESRRYHEDVEITKESLFEFMEPLLRRRKKLPRRILTEGNHENFIRRFVGQNPNMHSKISVRDLGYEDFGFEVYPFRRSVEIAGFHFVHHLGSQTGRPSRVDSPSNGFKSLGVSTVVGHTHTYYRGCVPFKNRRIWGLDVGCLIHKNMGFRENWSCDTAHKYWRGIVILNNAENGDADITEIRAETLGV
jgi:predicted phosphodiesterase